jgi:hypothetical protein
MQTDLEQSKIDSQHRIAQYRRQKAHEQKQLENAHKHELELLNLELLRIQNDTDRLREQHTEEMGKIQAAQVQRREEQKEEFEKQRRKIEEDNERVLAEKQSIITDLENTIQEWENKYKNREARQEDTEFIQRLDELVQERSDSLELLVASFRAFERELVAHESTYHSVFSREAPPVPLNPISDRRLKQDSAANLKAVSSTKRIPPLLTPRPSTPRTKSPQ